MAILTPLVGIGVISLDRAFPVTAGAEVGTTITGLIAALANAGADFEVSKEKKLYLRIYFLAFASSCACSRIFQCFRGCYLVCYSFYAQNPDWRSQILR